MRHPVSNFKNWKAAEGHLGLALNLHTHIWVHIKEEEGGQRQQPWQGWHCLLKYTEWVRIPLPPSKDLILTGFRIYIYKSKSAVNTKCMLHLCPYKIILPLLYPSIRRHRWLSYLCGMETERGKSSPVDYSCITVVVSDKVGFGLPIGNVPI